MWAVVEAIVGRSRQRALGLGMGLLAVAGWGAALAAVMIGPGLELVRQSIRTQLDASQVGLGYFQLEDLWTLLQPNYYGVLLDSRYTGPGDVTQHYLYASILLVPLALWAPATPGPCGSPWRWACRSYCMRSAPAPACST